ncbi:MAG TPA: DUF2027 domain-containing protein [Paludibacteraceae bacterium]|nr:DUF2027 domain-containing protein [Paludibacteraceae bacterium]
MIKVGDKVRFLNSTGGGIVTRIDEREKIVYVSDADGFEIPMLERECVVIPEVNENTNFPKKDFKSASAAFMNENESPAAKSINLPPKPEIIEEEIFETPEGENLRVFLAFVPEDIKQLQTTSNDFYLVNDSNYFLFYNLALFENECCKSVANGLIEPNMQEWMAEIKKEELNAWEKIRVQIIPFKKDKTYRPQPVIDIDLKLNLMKFYKLHSFGENEYFDVPAMMLNPLEEIETHQLQDISAEEIKQAISQKEKPERRPRISKPAKNPEIVEVDLHINQLVDTTVGMNNADMLELQLEKFESVLNDYKNRKGQKIVFIHGKGEGVLRKEIEKLLRTKYKSYYFQDASFQQYGFGATMVTIR